MILKSHEQLSDEDLESQFKEYTLPPRLFSHAAHLRLALIHLRKYGKDLAKENLSFQIRGYADSLGANQKFNLTITIASIEILANYLASNPTLDFCGLQEKHSELFEDFKGIVKKHYSFNVFGDPKAKAEFIAPDLQPF